MVTTEPAVMTLTIGPIITSSAVSAEHFMRNSIGSS
jgi:hypothetical protein